MSRPPRPVTADVARWSAGVLLGLLLGAAAVVVWRRMVGALTSPLTPSLLLAVGLTAAAAAFCIRLLWRRFDGRPTRRGWLVALWPSAALLAIGISLSLPGTIAGGLWTFWALLAAEEGWAWQSAVLRVIQHRQHLPFPPSVLPLSQRPHPSPLPEGEGTRARLPEGEGTLLQQWTRTEAADGSEELLGWVRASFAAGQRTQNVHLAFCPPFAKTPELAVEQVDGLPSRVRTVQLLPYGARLELKLAAAAEGPTSVLLQFSARAAGGKGMKDEG